MPPFVLALILCPAMALAQLDLKPYNVTALEFFEHLDEGQDGTLDNAEIALHFKEYDSDGSGEVSLAEFTAHMDSDHPEFKGYEADLMKFYDINGDGALKQDDFEALFIQYDTNNDQIITQAEFVGPFSGMLQVVETALNN